MLRSLKSKNVHSLEKSELYNEVISFDLRLRFRNYIVKSEEPNMKNLFLLSLNIIALQIFIFIDRYIYIK